MPETGIIYYGRLFTNPGKIICIGLNYKRHAAEVKMKEPNQPVLFNKYNNALAAANCTITLPPKEISYKFDYETELLIVIGKRARNVSEADGPNYIAGYCTSNDFSARDLQLETPSVQWMIGKTLDNFAPIGPYFVGVDIVGDPHKLKIQPLSMAKSVRIGAPTISSSIAISSSHSLPADDKTRLRSQRHWKFFLSLMQIDLGWRVTVFRAGSAVVTFIYSSRLTMMCMRAENFGG